MYGRGGEVDVVEVAVVEEREPVASGGSFRVRDGERARKNEGGQRSRGVERVKCDDEKRGDEVEIMKEEWRMFLAFVEVEKLYNHHACSASN